MQRNGGKQQSGKDQRSRQENERYQGIISGKYGLDKDRNGMDLTKAEDIKKMWQEFTEELYQKDLFSYFCFLFIYFYFILFYFPNPEHPSHLPPHIISLNHPHAQAPSILYPVSNIDW